MQHMTCVVLSKACAHWDAAYASATWTEAPNVTGALTEY
jgi:hypothetical protein